MPASSSASLLLDAATPDDWIETHLAQHYRQHHADDGGPPRPWVTIADVLADDAGQLRRTHTRLCADDETTPNAAAKWVTSWYPGMVADAVGFTLAAAAAGLLLDSARLRLRLHPDGWVDQVDPLGSAAPVGSTGSAGSYLAPRSTVDAGPTVAVAAGHPWAGLPGVLVVADEHEVARLAVKALTVAVEPLVEGCRTLARVGRTSLWAEVADGFGLPLLMQPELPVDPAAVRRLQSGLRAEGALWRRRPDLRVDHNGRNADYLGRKGGCCLAYQCTDNSAIDLDSLDPQSRAFEERFPTGPGEPRFCSTCSLRELGDCEDRQLFWLRSEREARCSLADAE